ncbi:hypothetical protein ADUPG1_010332, partial [Aduncisulcus paluster]
PEAFEPRHVREDVMTDICNAIEMVLFNKTSLNKVIEECYRVYSEYYEAFFEDGLSRLSESGMWVAKKYASDHKIKLPSPGKTKPSSKPADDADLDGVDDLDLEDEGDLSFVAPVCFETVAKELWHAFKIPPSCLFPAESSFFTLVPSFPRARRLFLQAMLVPYPTLFMNNLERVRECIHQEANENSDILKARGITIPKGEGMLARDVMAELFSVALADMFLWLRQAGSEALQQKMMDISKHFDPISTKCPTAASPEDAGDGEADAFRCLTQDQLDKMCVSGPGDYLLRCWISTECLWDESWMKTAYSYLPLMMDELVARVGGAADIYTQMRVKEKTGDKKDEGKRK